MLFENENLEFKSQFTEEIYKEVIAFANTDGGTVYIGIDNDGNIIGLNDVDSEYTRITNGIRDAIMPDVTMFVQYTIQDNKVVRIQVGEGTNKPYYLKSKGIKPSGVFVRQGASSVPASFEQIRKMIKDSDGDCFESMRSVKQDLSFNSAMSAFNRYNVEFSPEKYQVLGITDANSKMFTNLAQLVSDQCEHTTKIAVFGDDANTLFKDNKEFTGSIFRQLDEAYSYLTLCNNKKSTFKGLERIEKPDYPEEAIREALLNAIIHRDYSFSGSIIINVNSRQTEFVSIGGLVAGLTPEDIRSGISQPRNKNLAEMFHRLRLIESYGTGIRKIFKLYSNSSAQPTITVTPNTFRIILPNMNYMPMPEDTEAKPTGQPDITPQMNLILEYINHHGFITDEGIENLLGVKHTRAYIVAKKMCELGFLEVTGRGQAKKYSNPKSVI